MTAQDLFFETEPVFATSRGSRHHCVGKGHGLVLFFPPRTSSAVADAGSRNVLITSGAIFRVHIMWCPQVRLEPSVCSLEAVVFLKKNPFRPRFGCLSYCALWDEAGCARWITGTGLFPIKCSSSIPCRGSCESAGMCGH